ncbi:MAG TPA: hypothetical protein VHW65_04505, partial [Gemmatimonadales bacterium]|nr:hypothetical protein [Gemmatimonadales bacterium]
MLTIMPSTIPDSTPNTLVATAARLVTRRTPNAVAIVRMAKSKAPRTSSGEVRASGVIATTTDITNTSDEQKAQNDVTTNQINRVPLGFTTSSRLEIAGLGEHNRPPHRHTFVILTSWRLRCREGTEVEYAVGRQL